MAPDAREQGLEAVATKRYQDAIEHLAGIVRGGIPDLFPQFDYRYARRRCECRAVGCTT